VGDIQEECLPHPIAPLTRERENDEKNRSSSYPLEFDSFNDPIRIPSIDHPHDDDAVTQDLVKNPVITRPKAVKGRFESL
jgi:hypothetical protein